jgi:hypothetical protein
VLPIPYCSMPAGALQGQQFPSPFRLLYSPGTELFFWFLICAAGSSINYHNREGGPFKMARSTLQCTLGRSSNRCTRSADFARSEHLWPRRSRARSTQYCGIPIDKNSRGGHHRHRWSIRLCRDSARRFVRSCFERRGERPRESKSSLMCRG